MEAFAEGKIEALKAPSARDDDGFNWVIFPDRLKPGSSVQLLGLSPAVNGDNSDDNPKNRTLNDVDSDAYAEDENNTAEDELKSIAIDLMKDVRLE